jgi:TPP-dependent pyruvate/acetoin dehydrogenase alpha subunit
MATDVSSGTVTMSDELALDLYRRMVLIREFESAVERLFAAGELPGFVHLYLGQEAVASGVCANLRADDWIASTHRGHGHLLAKGGDPRRMMAELYGKVTGYCKGKGGSMHIADPTLGILGANGIVGAGIPIATGAALSAQIRGTDEVAVAFFGEGASNEGTFHESMNVAAARKLPVVYVCENNQYAVGTHVGRVTGNPEIHERASGYGMPGVSVDGNDVEAVYATVGEAVRRARAGDGPTLVEAKTYRWKTHFEGEPDTYRPPQEVADWKRRDPIPRFRHRVIEAGVASETLEAIDDDVNSLLSEAIEFGRSSALPQPEDALQDVFA